MDILFRVTFRCNKHCDFCYNDTFENKVDFSLIEQKDIMPLIEFIKKQGVSRCVISGGEPAVREDLADIIQKISTVCPVKVFTNGLLLKKYSGELLKKIGVSKVVYTVTEKNIEQPETLGELLPLIKEARKQDIVVDGNAFMTSSYFKYKELVLQNNIQDIFDHFRWQPLVYPEHSIRYSETIYGMEAELRNKIFDDAIECNWGGVGLFYEEFKKIFNAEGQRKPCLYPMRVVTVNPDLSVNICPHKSQINYSLAEAPIQTNLESHSKCLRPECLGIYSFE